MGYFANGSEGSGYEEEYCDKCIHNTGEMGCPIWGLHLLFNYDQNKKTPEGEAIAVVLDTLIPRSKDDLDNEQCSMFVPLLSQVKQQSTPYTTITPQQARNFWVAP